MQGIEREREGMVDMVVQVPFEALIVGGSILIGAGGMIWELKRMRTDFNDYKNRNCQRIKVIENWYHGVRDSGKSKEVTDEDKQYIEDE